ncbi:cell division protein FtsQ/DivIB [Sediminibacterium sp.]|uniref:cell division protein FtsQ/DivIB n=1 Tax=Sediminibacterium sp. TaxID=1917865 RepID=UPI003F6F52A5
MKKLNWKKILINTAWVLSLVGVLVLLGASIRQKNHKRIQGVIVEISGAEKHMFIDEQDVLHIINDPAPVTGRPMRGVKLRKLENLVEKNPWVHNAEMFFDNQFLLQVNIVEKEPIARIFETNGQSYYIDSAMSKLPLSNKLSARVPVFTGFPSTKKVDTALVQSVIQLATLISLDSFLTAQIAQIDIVGNHEFEMIPVIGDHLIAFGDSANAADKLNRLKAFYQAAWLQHGLNTYKVISLKFKGQVVGIKENAKIVDPQSNIPTQNPLTSKRNTL